jgi:hypothetical protein
MRTNFVELIRSDLEVKPADVKLLDLGSLGLLSVAGCFILPSVGVRLETWINFPLLEAKLFRLNSDDIVDSVPSINDQLV